MLKVKLETRDLEEHKVNGVLWEHRAQEVHKVSQVSQDHKDQEA